jgi:putative thioredoxin
MFSPPPANTVAAGAPGKDLIKDSSDRTFMVDVIEASQSVPVIVDFWAPWCGPCKQLGPALEKAVLAAKGAVRLVKIDTDQHPMIAQQLRVQSIPAVFAFFQGRPVDGFMGAVPESQVKAFVEKLSKLGGSSEAQMIEEVLAQAKQALDEGDLQTAAEIYSELLHADPASAPAYFGMVRCLIAAKDLERAKEMLAQVPEAIAKDKEMALVRSALEVAEQAEKAGPITELADKVARDPNDHQARLDLAMALFAAGKRQEAVDALLDSVRLDREWNEQAARKQLVKFFEAFGLADPLTVQTRRRLSSILFS